MKRTIKETMSRPPRTLPSTATIQDAAQAMRDCDIGNVVVIREEKVCGIVTDRDIVVRAVAEGRKDMQLGAICSSELITASPDENVGSVVEKMKENALRRVLVVDDGKLQGIVSLGDLAMNLDHRSVLSEISAAPPNT